MAGGSRKRINWTTSLLVAGSTSSRVARPREILYSVSVGVSSSLPSSSRPLSESLSAASLEGVCADRRELILKRHRGAMLLVEDQVVVRMGDHVADLVVGERAAPGPDNRWGLQELIPDDEGEAGDEHGADGTNHSEHALVEPHRGSLRLFFFFFLPPGFLGFFSLV